MSEKARGHRGQEHNPTLRTGEYPESKVVATSLMIVTGALVVLAKFLINRKQHSTTQKFSDLSRHPVITTFPSVTGSRRKR